MRSGVLLLVLLATLTISAQDFDLSWSSFNGGGIMGGTGDGFQLGSTIGQSEAGSSTDFILVGGFWSLVLNRPILTEQPASQTVNVGSSVSFTVTATGAGVLKYQWRFDDANIPNATSRTYALANAQPSNAGAYSVEVTDDFGSAVSEEAILTVLHVPEVPVLTAIAPESAVGGSGSLALTVNGAKFEPNAVVLWNGQARPTLFVNITQLTAQISGADIPAISDVAVALITVQNPGVGVSGPKPFTITAVNAGPVQTVIVNAGQNVVVQTPPPAPNQAGVSVSFSNQSATSPAATVTTATYNSAPPVAGTLDTGGGVVDLQISGADATDSASAKFYYSSAVTGSGEQNVLLRYYTGSAWDSVLSSGGGAPAKDSTDNLDNTVSGGRFTVLFDNTSTPKITVLNGTFFAMTINRAPLANPDTATVAEDVTLTIPAPGVLANDTDQDNDSLQVVLVSGTSHGTLTLQASGAFSYTSQPNYNGPDSFTYKVSDGAAESGAATVAIMVAPVNDTPVAASPLPDQTATYGTAFSYTFPIDTFADIDAGQTLTYSASDLPPGITFAAATRTLTGTPTQAGAFNVTITAADNGSPALSASDTFAFNVAKATPTLTWANPADITYGTALSASQLNAAANAPGSFSYAPAAGTVLNVGSRTLTATFTPADTANYTIRFANGTLTVTPAALSVTANNAARNYGEENPPFSGTITGLVNNDDIRAVYACAATPASPVGQYSITPSLLDPNSRLGNSTVTKNNGTLTVKNLPPVVNAGPDQEKVAGDEVTFAGSFTDPGSPSHVVGWDFGDGSPAVIGTLTPTHVFAKHGVYTVTLTVTDSHLASASDRLTVAVMSAFGCASDALERFKPFVKESQRLEKVIKDLTASLESKYWLDEVHLNPKGGRKAFVYWRQATDMMEQVLKPTKKREHEDEDEDEDDEEFKRIFKDSKKDTLGSAVIAAIQQAIVEVSCASRLISESVYLENEGLPALDPRRQKRVDAALARAKDLLAQANAPAEKSDFGKAVRRHIRSWNNTQDAIDAAGRSQPAKELAKALDLIEESLDPKYWLDESHLDLKTGQKAFNLMQAAARELANVMLDAAKGRVIPAVGLQAAEELADLVEKARRVSDRLYRDNAETLVAVNPKNQKAADADLKRAKENLDKGLAAEAADAFDKALTHYANAWDNTVNAIEQAARTK